jgi:hypothetical protein
MTIVCPIRGPVVVVAFCEDEDVITAAEGILEDGSWAQVNVGVMARSLVGGGTIKVPDSEFTDIRDLLAHGLLDPWSILIHHMVLQSLAAELTVVFERRPPSPSTQTSEENIESILDR